ncbi:MAG: amidohydrolase, partial [Planctomycetales bacterium]
QAIEDQYPEMVEVRRHLHCCPEPSGEELKTSMYVYQRLLDQGLPVHQGPEGLGVIVDSAASESGVGRIALRADMDALRIQDAKEVEYKSQEPGVMHACGHDCHTATLFGTLSALHVLEKSGALPWPVPWRGIFQPAEETSQGALLMIQAGALEDVEGIFALHVDPTRPVGQIGWRAGPLTANCDDMRMEIIGRGGHAARPHESLDPIAAAAQLISSMYLFVPRAVDSQDAVVVTIGQVIAGDNPNVIPETVSLRGTLRTLRPSVREQTMNHIRQLAHGIAHASSTDIQVEFHAGPQSVCNDPEMTEFLRRSADDLLGEKNLEHLPRTSMGGEDFSHYLSHVPGSMFRLGCASESKGGALLHSPLFDVDEQAMKVGAKILARAVILWADPARRETKEQS